MRFQFPIVGVRVVQRSAMGFPDIEMPRCLKGKVDLNKCLAYQVLEQDDEVRQWAASRVIDHSSDSPGRNDEEDEGEEFYGWARAKPAEPKHNIDGMLVHFWPGKRPRIALEQSHTISDGLACLTVVDELLSKLSQTIVQQVDEDVRWGDEVQRLPPAVQDAIADQPKTWDISPEEKRRLQKYNENRLNSQSASSSFVDKFGVTVYKQTLKNNTAKSPVVSKVMNKPLASLVRGIVESGEAYPIGLLPPSKKPWTGRRTINDFCSRKLSNAGLQQLLTRLRSEKTTVAPFLESCIAFATTYVRRQRSLPPTKDGWDDEKKVHALFANPVSRRYLFRPEHRRYMGDAQSGFPTQITVKKLRWPETSFPSTIPTSAESEPPVINEDVLANVFEVSRELGIQYKAGKEDKDWYKLLKATMFDAMQTEYLLVRDEAFYPSNPWFTSLGRMDDTLKPRRPLGATCELVATCPRFVVRVGRAQPTIQAYTFAQEGMTLQMLWPQWWYDLEDSPGRFKLKRGKRVQGLHDESILKPWFDTFCRLVEAAASSTVASGPVNLSAPAISGSETSASAVHDSTNPTSTASTTNDSSYIASHTSEHAASAPATHA